MLHRIGFRELNVCMNIFKVEVIILTTSQTNILNVYLVPSHDDITSQMAELKPYQLLIRARFLMNLTDYAIPIAKSVRFKV